MYLYHKSCNLDLRHIDIACKVQWMTGVSIWTGTGMLVNTTWSTVKTAVQRETCYSLSGQGRIAPFFEASSLEVFCFPKKVFFILLSLRIGNVIQICPERRS